MSILRVLLCGEEELLNSREEEDHCISRSAEHMDVVNIFRNFVFSLVEAQEDKYISLQHLYLMTLHPSVIHPSIYARIFESIDVLFDNKKSENRALLKVQSDTCIFGEIVALP